MTVSGRGALSTLLGAPHVTSSIRRLTMRKALPRALWRRLPVTPEEFTVPLGRGEAFRCAAPAGDAGIRALYWRGIEGWEPETLRVFRRLVAEAEVFVDVGANKGIFSLVALASSPRLRVEAFEPVDRVRAALTDNLGRNGWLGRATVHDVALSDRSGTADFLVPSGALPRSAHLTSAAYRSSTGTVTEVPVQPLDSVVTGRVDLIKIDVEGTEDSVLRGARRILAEQRPVLVIECLPEGPCRQVQSELAAHNYRFAHLTDRGPVAVTDIVPDPARRLRNFLCTPDE